MNDFGDSRESPGQACVQHRSPAEDGLEIPRRSCSLKLSLGGGLGACATDFLSITSNLIKPSWPWVRGSRQHLRTAGIEKLLIDQVVRMTWPCEGVAGLIHPYPGAASWPSDFPTCLRQNETNTLISGFQNFGLREEILLEDSNFSSCRRLSACSLNGLSYRFQTCLASSHNPINQLFAINLLM